MDKIRTKLFHFLLTNQGKEFQATELEKYIDASKTTINSYLRDLEIDSLATRREEGYYCYWKINPRLTMKHHIMCKKWTIDLLDLVIQKE